jgi:Cu(I)/Ag(I) efflux system membrane fusion protein
MTTKYRGALILIGLGVTLAAGYWLGQRHGGSPGSDRPAMAMTPAEREPLYWYDPMVPDQHFDAPGKSPFMDMMLVPRYADEGGDSTGVRVDPGLQQSLGVRTAVVELDAVAAEVRAPGTVQWDLRQEQRVGARVEGLVERVHQRAPFARVRRGEPLATILSPELSAALAEYHALSRSRSDSARQLQSAAKSRLQLLGLTAADLHAFDGDGAPRILLRAPADGLLTEINAREGDTVLPGQTLFRLNASDPVWLEARVPQAEVGSLAAGAAAVVEVSAFPGQTFHGTIESVLPDLDPMTRTQGVRIVLPNPDGHLAAGMFADAQLQGARSKRCPWVPSEALILTGRDARVIVQQEDGRFRPVRVTTGRQIAGRTEILDGLDGGESVVVSGQFLIDSEASLSGALSRLESKAGEDTTDALQHDGEHP